SNCSGPVCSTPWPGSAASSSASRPSRSALAAGESGLGVDFGFLDLGRTAAGLIQQVQNLLAHIEVTPAAGQPPRWQTTVAGHVEDRLGAHVEKVCNLFHREEVV